jgi:AcrR family transcriptional regulator
MNTKAPRWQRRADDRPREICAAALEVFAEKGFAAAKLDEIARQAGVSKGTLYLYFKDKEELFRAVVRSAISPNIALLSQSLDAADLPFAALFPMLIERFAAMTRQVPIGAVAKMVIGESRNFPELAKVWHDEVVAKGLDTVAELVTRAQERGELKAVDPRLVGFSLMGPMMMGVLWSEILVPAGAEPIDIEALARQHAAIVLSGLSQ